MTDLKSYYYVREDILGQGVFGTVYALRNKKTNQESPYCIKVLNRTYPNLACRFRAFHLLPNEAHYNSILLRYGLSTVQFYESGWGYQVKKRINGKTLYALRHELLYSPRLRREIVGLYQILNHYRLRICDLNSKNIMFDEDNQTFTVIDCLDVKEDDTPLEPTALYGLLGDGIWNQSRLCPEERIYRELIDYLKHHQTKLSAEEDKVLVEKTLETKPHVFPRIERALNGGQYFVLYPTDIDDVQNPTPFDYSLGSQKHFLLYLYFLNTLEVKKTEHFFEPQRHWCASSEQDLIYFYPFFTEQVRRKYQDTISNLITINKDNSGHYSYFLILACTLASYMAIAPQIINVILQRSVKREESSQQEVLKILLIFVFSIIPLFLVGIIDTTLKKTNQESTFNSYCLPENKLTRDGLLEVSVGPVVNSVFKTLSGNPNRLESRLKRVQSEFQKCEKNREFMVTKRFEEAREMYSNIRFIDFSDYKKVVLKQFEVQQSEYRHIAENNKYAKKLK